MRAFGDVLKELRKERDITQEDIAKALNTRKSTISNWENNRRFPKTQQKLIELAQFFDVSTDYLLGLSQLRRGRLLTKAELKTFLPEKVANHPDLQIRMENEELTPQAKEEIFKVLQKEGLL